MAALYPVSPVSLSERQNKRRQNIDKRLAAILEVLNTGTAAKLPFVQTAFGSAARIFEISQKVRANQYEFGELAEEACRLVYDISVKLADKQEIEQDLKANLEELLETLQSIQSFGEKSTARGVIKAVLLHGFGLNEIKAQRRKLERCMRLFDFQSLLELREKTNQLVEQQAKNGDIFNTKTNTNNTTENNISFGDNETFERSNSNVMISGNYINHYNHSSSNNHGGSTGYSSTKTEYTNNRVNNSTSFGSRANFSNTNSNALGANNDINFSHYNSLISLGSNVFGANNVINKSILFGNDDSFSNTLANTLVNTDNNLKTIVERLATTQTRDSSVQLACDSAVEVFNISQKVQRDENNLATFADGSCRLVYSVSLRSAHKQEDLEELVETLRSIQIFGEKRVERSPMKAVLMHGFDADEINEQKRKLERCIRLFGFQSLRDLRQKTNQLLKQQGDDVSNSTTNTNITVSPGNFNPQH